MKFNIIIKVKIMKTKELLFLLICTFWSVRTYAQTLVNGIYYSFSETEATVIGADGEKVVIPIIKP